MSESNKPLTIDAKGGGKQATIAALLESAKAAGAKIEIVGSGMHSKFNKIVMLGHPVLHAPAREVAPADYPFVLGELLPAMQIAHDRAWTAGVGLSAPQVGSDLRVTIAKLGTSVGKSQITGQWHRMVNPRLIAASPNAELFTQEGCLSVPGFRTSVHRASWVEIAWHEPNDTGGLVHRQGRFKGFDAEILQHELDHLAGITIVDHCSRPQRRAALRGVNKFIEKHGG